MKRKILFGSIVLSCALGLALTGCQGKQDTNPAGNEVTDVSEIVDNTEEIPELETIDSEEEVDTNNDEVINNEEIIEETIEDGFSLESFVGSWINADEEFVIVIDGNYRFAAIYDGEITCIGSIKPAYGVSELYTTEGVHYCSLTYDSAENCIVDQDNNIFTYAGTADKYIEGGFVPEDEE